MLLKVCFDSVRNDKFEKIQIGKIYKKEPFIYLNLSLLHDTCLNALISRDLFHLRKFSTVCSQYIEPI